MTEPIVRRMRADEWPQLRALRLEALADAPLAFGSTLERESAYTEERWRAEAASAAASDGVAGYVAVTADRWVAMARGYVDDDESADGRPLVWLFGVYVTPAWRGRGLAGAVSEEVVRWARSIGAAEVRLHVAEWNDAARRTYDSLRFVPTGATTTLPHDARVAEVEMRLRLD